MVLIFLLAVLIIPIDSHQIPFISNVIFVPLSQSNSTILNNITCDHCLCMISSFELILNCLPNDTCQYFSNFPQQYQIQTLNNSRLYFPQNLFPNASQCSMPNISSVLSRIQSANQTFATVRKPRCLSIDNHGYLITISQQNNTLVRLNSTDLTLIDQTYKFTSPQTIKYYDQHYYVGLTNSILVIDSNSLIIKNNITSTNLSGTRDMMFMKNGDLLVVASTNNNRLLFFNRTNANSTIYNLFYQQNVTYSNPHGFFYVNDSFFYVTSWALNRIYSYSFIENTSTWNEILVVNAQSIATNSSGNHITIDECDRFWFSLSNYGIQIFDNQGLFLTNLTFPNGTIFDTILTTNYLVYLSNTATNQLIRLDPQISF